MSCPQEQVTGYVDGALDPRGRADVEEHLAQCTACREQVEAERALRMQLRALPAPVMPAPLEHAVRRKLRARGNGVRRTLLGLAAALVGLLLWGRAAPPLVQWELAWDHAHCYGKERLPAQVLTGDPAVASAWFEERGTQLPLVPASVGDLELSGARFCPLLDRKVAHLYYVAGKRHASLYVVPGPVRVETAEPAVRGQQFVSLMQVAGSTVGIVAEHEEDVAAMRKAFTHTYARAAGFR